MTPTFSAVAAVRHCCEFLTYGGVSEGREAMPRATIADDGFEDMCGASHRQEGEVREGEDASVFTDDL